jgi:hypothetical protein
MPNTTNFNWSTPADTDLVKDGASAIRTLGNSIDTSFVDLKGGTTDQVLAKNSNTDLDYKWISTGGITLLSTTTMSGATTTISSIPQTYLDLRIVVVGATPNVGSQLSLGWNGGAIDFSRFSVAGDAGFSSTGASGSTMLMNTETIRQSTSGGNGGGVYIIDMENYTSTTFNKGGYFVAQNLKTTNYNAHNAGFFGLNSIASAVTSISLAWNSSATATAGTVYIYGIK